MTLEPRYRIAACSCSCGGSYAWMKRRPSGAWNSIGCICHNSPPWPNVRWIRWRYFTREGWRYQGPMPAQSLGSEARAEWTLPLDPDSDDYYDDHLPFWCFVCKASHSYNEGHNYTPPNPEDLR
jgi:hypothetical protein